MLKDLHTLTPYLDFIRTCNADPDYRDPMLLTQQQLHRNLLDAPENPNTRVFGTFEGEAITGVFALLVLLIPYVMHYYLLENSVQKMYEQYDRMMNKIEPSFQVKPDDKK